MQLHWRELFWWFVSFWCWWLNLMLRYMLWFCCDSILFAIWWPNLVSGVLDRLMIKLEEYCWKSKLLVLVVCVDLRFGQEVLFEWYPDRICLQKCKLWVIRFKVFKNEPSEICGRQPLKSLKCYGLPKQTISLQIF